ncbi:hypothetical protein SARC_17737, partial [Sphaeroforma arctica JP610]
MIGRHSSYTKYGTRAWFLTVKLPPLRFSLKTATEKFPDYSKLWMVKGQVNVDLGQIETARSTYTKA